jgi:tetratricopeptide (TPR) repeat protein
MNAEEILQMALDQKTPAEQAAYLSGACGDDAALRAQIEGLLRAHQAAGSFLEQPVFESTPTIDEPITERPGTVIGPYKLLEQIGEGGFGVVFMAEQQQPIRRKVALKILKPGMDTRQVVVRFEAERQALALMDHPNIAKVLDGGATAGGRPYFVMDLVKGITITEFCDQNQIPIAQRLELFLSVCQAVQHAHQKGIIHRDIKPSNVLVMSNDGMPLVKVIDFGVAKALGQELTDKTLFTGFAQMIGTPLYMSPEQAGQSSLDVDTRSDIYSLGVLLYELLTGTTPFDKERLRTAGYDEIRRIIREEEPPKPSTRISTLGQASTAISTQRKSDPKKLSQLCRGELDWIVMKALEKDRNRRYESASTFAADVQRYLHDEPVQACPPSTWYRLRKFVRRNKSRLAVATCLAGVILVCLLAGTALWYQRYQRLKVVSDSVHKSVSDARGLLASNQLTRVHQALAEAKGQLGKDRDALSSLANEVEALDSEVARLEKFYALIDQAFDAEVPHAAAEVLRSESSSNRQRAAEVRDEYGRVSSRAAPFFLEALSVYGVMEQEDWNSALASGLLAPEQMQRIRQTTHEALLWLADNLVVRQADYQTGRKLSAESAGRLAMIYVQKAEATRPATPALFRIRSACSRLLNDENGARADEERVRQSSAVMALDHYLLGLRAFYAKDKQGAFLQFEAALELEPTHYWSLMWLGVSLLDLGQEQEWIEAVRVFTGGIMKRPDQFTGYDLRGRAYQKLRRNVQALADFSKAIDLNPNSASTLTSRGNVFFALNRLDEALADHERAIRLQPDYAEAHVNLGHVLVRKDRLDKAISEYEQAIGLKPDLFQAHASLGEALWLKRQGDQAIAEINKAIRLKSDDPGMHELWGIVLCDAKGEYDKAILEFKEAIRLDPRHAQTHFNLGQANRKKGQIDDAIRAYREAVRLKPDYGEAHNRLAVALKDNRQFDEAIAEFGEAIRRDPKNADPHINLGAYWCDVKQDYDRAIAEFSEANRLKPKEPITHFNLGIAFRKKGLLDQAISEFAEATRLKPNYGQAYFELGGVLRSRGKFADAAVAFRELTHLEPNNASGYNGLGGTLFDLEKFVESEAAFREAIRLQPQQALYHSNHGNALLGLRKFAEADAAYREALRLEPKDANTLNQAAWFHATCPDTKFRDPQRAVQLAKKAVEQAPKEGNYLNTLGVAQYRAGDYKAALAALQESMMLSPGGDGEDWFWLAMVHWKLGEIDEARNWYHKAVDWMEKSQPKNEELGRIHAEAKDLLGVNK